MACVMKDSYKHERSSPCGCGKPGLHGWTMAWVRKSEVLIVALTGATTQRAASEGALLYLKLPKRGGRSDWRTQ
jgi:hypothetical protein